MHGRLEFDEQKVAGCFSCREDRLCMYRWDIRNNTRYYDARVCAVAMSKAAWHNNQPGLTSLAREFWDLKEVKLWESPRQRVSLNRLLQSLQEPVGLRFSPVLRVAFAKGRCAHVSRNGCLSTLTPCTSKAASSCMAVRQAPSWSGALVKTTTRVCVGYPLLVSSTCGAETAPVRCHPHSCV